MAVQITRSANVLDLPLMACFKNRNKETALIYTVQYAFEWNISAELLMEHQIKVKLRAIYGNLSMRKSQYNSFWYQITEYSTIQPTSMI